MLSDRTFKIWPGCEEDRGYWISSTHIRQLTTTWDHLCPLRSDRLSDTCCLRLISVHLTSFSLLSSCGHCLWLSSGHLTYWSNPVTWSLSTYTTFSPAPRVPTLESFSLPHLLRVALALMRCPRLWGGTLAAPFTLVSYSSAAVVFSTELFFSEHSLLSQGCVSVSVLFLLLPSNYCVLHVRYLPTIAVYTEVSRK